MSDQRLADWALRYVLENLLEDLIECDQTEEPTDWRTRTIFDLVEARDRPERYLARQPALHGSSLALWQTTRREAGAETTAPVITVEDFALWRKIHGSVDTRMAPGDETLLDPAEGTPIAWDPTRGWTADSHALAHPKQPPERQPPMNNALLDRAKRGYQAYGEFRNWKNYTGLPMPPWDELPPEIQEAWRAATAAIVAASDDVAARRPGAP